jgi:hypothetical protein
MNRPDGGMRQLLSLGKRNVKLTITSCPTSKYSRIKEGNQRCDGRRSSSHSAISRRGLRLCRITNRHPMIQAETLGWKISKRSRRSYGQFTQAQV